MFDYLESFVTLMEQKPELFTDDDLQDLMQQVPNWSDDKDDLEDAIVIWLEERPIIEGEIDKRLEARSRFTEAVKYPGTPGNHSKEIQIKPEDWKPFLLNAIHRCSETNFGKKKIVKIFPQAKRSRNRSQGFISVTNL